MSVVLARGDDGTLAAFPPGENRHVDGILETTLVPARFPGGVLDRAVALAGEVAARLEYVGVLGLELFVSEDGRLYANEMAPRPHNSGHYTLNACDVCQFEQQVRALAGLPLTEPRLLWGTCGAGASRAGRPRWPSPGYHSTSTASGSPGRDARWDI